jgi:hypothetical protein
MVYGLCHYTSLQTGLEQEVSEAQCTKYERVGKLHHCSRQRTDLVAPSAQPCKRYRGPPVKRIKLIIHITNDVCPDCSNFRARTLFYTGIDISLEKL